MSISQTIVHYAESISLEVVLFDDFVNHRFTITCKDGSKHEFDAFASQVIELERLPDSFVKDKK